jgi:amidohydrolase
MIKEGVLERTQPDFALGLHLWNEKPLGWLGISPGPVMSASETFRIKIQGKGGHGGIPHKAVDPIVASASVINAIQPLTAREVNPLESAVVSVCTIHAGDAPNVIPEEVLISGTIRTFRQGTREMVLHRFQEIVRGVAQAHQCQAEITLEKISPAVENHPQITEVVRQTARNLFPEAVVEEAYQTMASEDMAFFLAEIPGCYSLIGSANPEQGLAAKHHQPDFDFDEQALITGTALVMGAVFNLLTPEFQI